RPTSCSAASPSPTARGCRRPGRRAACRRRLGATSWTRCGAWGWCGATGCFSTCWRRGRRRGSTGEATTAWRAEATSGGGAGGARVTVGAWMDRAVAALLFFVRPGTRLLIVKDFRTFRRDPQQWGQVVVFTGLLALYFGSVKRLFIHDVPWVYQNSISALNLC